MVRVQKFLWFFILSGFLFTVNSKYCFNSWCCILDYFILNCKLWDNFLISMIIHILIISYILIFCRNFELIFEFMALKRAPICGRNVCLAFFFWLIFNIQNQLKTYKIQLQLILVLSKSKIVDSTYKLVILKIHRTAVVFDCVLSVCHEAFVHAPPF